MSDNNSLPQNVCVSSSSSSLSKFEYLTTELRLRIYTFLGFPVDKIQSLFCIHQYPPQYTYFGNAGQHLCPGWKSEPIRLIGIKFHDAFASRTELMLLRSNSELLNLPDICGKKGCGLRPLKSAKWMVMETGMMRVNRHIHADKSLHLHIPQRTARACRSSCTHRTPAFLRDAGSPTYGRLLKYSSESGRTAKSSRRSRSRHTSKSRGAGATTMCSRNRRDMRETLWFVR